MQPLILFTKHFFYFHRGESHTRSRSEVEKDRGKKKRDNGAGQRGECDSGQRTFFIFFIQFLLCNWSLVSLIG